MAPKIMKVYIEKLLLYMIKNKDQDVFLKKKTERLLSEKKCKMAESFAIYKDVKCRNDEKCLFLRLKNFFI